MSERAVRRHWSRDTKLVPAHPEPGTVTVHTYRCGCWRGPGMGLACWPCLSPCSAGPGTCACLGPHYGRKGWSLRSSGLVYALTCLSSQRTGPLLPSSPVPPSNSGENKRTIHAKGEGMSREGGGCHRQTPLKATGCSFTFTLLKNVN